MTRSKSKVRLKARRHIYIHNDMGDAVFYFKKLTLLAFEVEARFNFLGYKLIEGWDEWQSAKKKVETVCDHLGVVPDLKARPYLSIEKLRCFRDTLAHGKPEDRVFEEEVVATAEELAVMRILPAEWEASIGDPGFFRDAYGDVEQIWQELLTRCGRVEERIAKDDHEGVALEIMAGL